MRGYVKPLFGALTETTERCGCNFYTQYSDQPYVQDGGDTQCDPHYQENCPPPPQLGLAEVERFWKNKKPRLPSGEA